jgi:hypothetical protein
MKWLSRFLVLVAGTMSAISAKKFFDNNTLLVFRNEDLVDSQEPESLDLRGTPTHACVCGSVVWNIRAVFDNYEIATYFLDMECVECGSLATAPTPLDREGMEY